MLLTVEQHTVDHGLCLDRVVPAAPALVDAVDDVRLHPEVWRAVRRTGERLEGVAVRRVEAVVAVGDEGLVLAAVVPGEREGRQRALAGLEDALEEVEVLVDVLVADGLGEEGGRRQLLLVTRHDELTR
ncbi:hypothetical protein, partial [Streptomyces rhizosphaericus]|uniref:hypothetical protein n=1 Tax=Streptomyces rhizosphaericus TaxID=114699 RepID=UPI003CD0AA2F